MITEAAFWSPQIAEIGQIVEDAQEVNQTIGIILQTPKGTDPHRPTFGSNLHNYLDYPIDRAKPHLIRETVRALREWEPRITVEKVTVMLASFEPQQVRIQVQWKLVGDTTFRTAEVLV